MTEPLAGIRVLEVASHVFVPVAGAVLTEWGAEVVKIEHPETGDPYRGLVTSGLHKLHNGVDPNFQYANRGKQSVGIDLKTDEGRALIYRLAAVCDVFLTNFRPDARRRLGIEVDDIRAHNDSIIYVRGSGYGARGPDVQRGGYDSAAFWSRSGMADAFTPAGAEWPASPRPAFGDIVGGLTIAGAIATALYRRLATGEPSVVDVSLLGMGMWQLQPDIISAKLSEEGGSTHTGVRSRYQSWNPAVQTYRTRDGRFISLVMLDADRYWADLCTTIGHPEMATDPRFVDMPTRAANSEACVRMLDDIFASRDYADWCDVLADAAGVWTPIQSPLEVHRDPQVAANGYLADVDMENGTSLTMVTSPVQFDEQPWAPTRAPEHGEHTESTLLGLGLSWDEISALKERNVIL
ncbi:MAG: L-carnitine dehydratase/bile acid-inducible protein [Actinomycetia bacterium]|nr:L-carnitine dehydratase/bile acid-inducible protein [Actinomycetes bacterium]